MYSLLISAADSVTRGNGPSDCWYQKSRAPV